MKDKYIATLVGCGLGDTLGMSVEGWKQGQIKKYVGRVTQPIAPVIIRDAQGNEIISDEFGKLIYCTRDLSVGDITDDTVLSIAIAESIVDKKFMDLNNIMQKQFEAYDVRIQPDGHIFGGFGKSTIDAFENFRKGILSENCGVFPGTGTGPCMKMSPIGLYMHATGRNKESREMAGLIGLSTHLDKRAVACGVVQADAIYNLLNGISKEDFIDSAISCCNQYEKLNPPGYPKFEKGTLLSRLNWVKDNKDVSSEEAKKVLGSSSLAISAYPFTLFMFQKYWDNPIEGLIETVNYGGDCDTTGAMYGALCGAKNGVIFPEDWKLNERARLTVLGEKLYAIGENK